MNTIRSFLQALNPASPTLVVDLSIVETTYRELSEHLGFADCHYAVKSNPAPEVLSLLVQLGSGFDVASVNEINMCLDAGATGDRLIYSNTIKKSQDIAYAYAHGVRMFSFDCLEELEKIAQAAPGSRVYCRIATDGKGAAWPLSRKFGCSAERAITLLTHAAEAELNVVPYGISFHVGSQQLDPTAWTRAIADAARVFQGCKERNVELVCVNIGGGYPIEYRTPVPGLAEIGATVRSAFAEYFGGLPAHVLMEPGRIVAGAAGVIQAEAALVTRKEDGERWVYLDVGKYNGLTEAEAIQYRMTTEKDADPMGRVVIAGPTCDSVDIVYQEAHYELPLTLTAGDKVWLHSAGAYTTTYATMYFNGFSPLKEYYINAPGAVASENAGKIVRLSRMKKAA